MKKTVTILFILMSILLFVCSERQPTGPSSNDDYILEAVETIDSDGGAIVIEDFSLIIPAGAFDAAYEISVYTTSDDNDFGEYSATRLFAVHGLPETYSKSLRLALKYTGTISGESYIGFGKLAKDIMTGDSSVVYRAIAATDSSGFLVCSVNQQGSPVNALKKTISFKNENDNPNPGELVHIQGSKDYKTDYADHFTIELPNNLVNRIEDVKTILEDCYNIITGDIGISFPSDWKLPIEVYFKPMKVEAVWYFIDPYEGTFNINAPNSLIASSSRLPEFKSMFGQSLFHACLSGFSGGVYHPETDMWELYWLRIATETWAEELFSEPGSYKAPSEFPGNEMAPFMGIKKNIGSTMVSAGSHGYGMSAMIKYLVDDTNYGFPGLVNTYKSLSQETPIEALITNVKTPVADWWPKFFIQYVGGNIYGVPSSVFTKTENLSGTWDINSDTDIEKKFTSGEIISYPDMSAKLFAVNLNHSTIDPSANLRIEVSGDETDDFDFLTTIAFVLKNDILEYIGHAHASVADLEIPGLRNYYDQGWRQFLIVVVNSNFNAPYTGTSNIYLTLTVEETLSELDFNTCTVDVKVTGRYNRITPDSNYTTDVCTINPASTGYQGSFSNNTFNGSYFKTEGPNITVTGSIEAVLDENHTTILSLNWSENHVNIEHNWTQTKALSAQNIPLGYSSDWLMVFAVLGETVTDHIITIRNDQSSDGLSYAIQEYWSDADSYIEVEFYTE